VVTVFFVEEIDLVVEDFDADQDRSLIFTAPTKGLHLASLWVLLIYVLVVVVDLVTRVNLVEEERQEDEVMVEVL